MLKTKKDATASKQIKFVAFHHWMIGMPLTNLELYLYGGLFGLTEAYGAWRGSIVKMVDFLKLNSFTDKEIEDAVNHLSELNLITVKKWTYPNTFEITAQKYCTASHSANGGNEDE